LFLERTSRAANRASSFNGTISFNTDPSNPLNTNIGFSNALLGAVTSYTESTVHPRAVVDFVNLEWYLQDNWRVARRFTVDAGLRFYYITPARSSGGELAMFVPARWNPALAPQLIEPVQTADGRRGRNPATGEILPLVYVGRLVPGSGDPYNGMQVFDRAVQDTPPVQAAPRIGFAWDVTGDGNTAVRGGAGVFYDRYGDGEVLQFSELPPLVDTYTTNYSTLSGLLASPLTATPTAVRNFDTFKPPVVYNWSLGAQRALGRGLVGDAAYVGNAGRRQLVSRQINGQPYGYSYLPSSLDPTNVVGGQAQPLPANFLRSYPGFAGIIQREFSGYSDYHSIQLSVNRPRSSEGLSFGASYTYEIVNKLLDTIDPFVGNNRARNYTSFGRRPHNVVINYSYEIPDSLWRNRLVRAALGNWQVSGITQIVSGPRQGFSYAYVNVPGGALSGTGGVDAGASRVDVLCDPNLSRGDRTFDRQFRTECVSAPGDQFRLGNARGDEYQGPGFMNFDFSLFKNIPLGSRRRLQFRLELYNAFNADQWTATDTSATFDYQTGAQTDANFGRLTGATQSARRIQLGARFTF
jgi:hypothetical protein